MRGSRLFLQPFRPEVDWSGWGYPRSPRLPPTGPRCSCGEPGVHAIATRTTMDGYRVRIYSDGQVVTDPDSRGQTFPYTARELQAARALADMVGWLDREEVGAAHRALLGLHEHLVKPTPADERAAVREVLRG